MGIHVAIIMDGNGRWAAERGWPRTRGHRAGADAVRKVVSSAPSLGIGVLTLYAFSSDNWKRPPGEVSTLMRLFRRYLAAEKAALAEKGVRLSVIGRRDRLDPDLVEHIERAEAATAAGRQLHLQLAVDYSSRDCIVAAAAECAGMRLDRESFRKSLARAGHSDPGVPEVDLLIRTGRELRLSDFLLWECAYAELYFSSCMWPEFGAAELGEAVRAFRDRERRFGAAGAERVREGAGVAV